MCEGTDYKWQVPTMDTRLKEIGKLQKFCEKLPLDISVNSIHRKKLDFKASNKHICRSSTPRAIPFGGK